MESRKYTISWDQLRDGYNFSPEEVAIANEANKLAKTGGTFSESFVNKLKRAIQKFPKNPSLKNYLGISYQSNQQYEELDELIEETLSKHPDYFFGRSMKSEQLLENFLLEEVAEIMAGFKDIGFIYPDRNEFHISEVKAFYVLAIKYHLLNNEEGKAIKALRKLDEIGVHIEEIQAIATFAERYKLRVSFKNFTNSFSFDEDDEIEAVRKSDLPQTIEPIKLRHDVISELYHNGSGISIDLFNRILQLPRETLITDLENVVLDAIRMVDYFYSPEIQFPEEQTTFPIHALLLLSELEAEESLQTVLELFRQERRIVDYWFSDFAETLFQRIFLKIANNQFDRLQEYIREPENDAFNRAIIVDCMITIYLHLPEKQEEVLQWFENLLDYLWENRTDETIVSGYLLAGISSNLEGIRAFDFMRKHLPKFFDEGLVDEEIGGGLENYLENEQWTDKVVAVEIETMEEVYGGLAISNWSELKKREYDENRPDKFDDELLFGESLFEKAFDEKYINSLKKTQAPKVAEQKIGRNDPCFCGSGKKYKKCHG